MNKEKGFTLVELLVASLLVLILSTVALPAYNSFRLQQLVPPGLTTLEEAADQLGATKRSFRNYGSSCNVKLSKQDNFSFQCAVTRGGNGYLLTATGVEKLQGYAYTLDETGARATVRHPKGAPAQPCWSVRGTVCDYEG